MELVLDILDHARYWIEHMKETNHRAFLVDEQWSNDFSGTISYIAISAFPSEQSV